MKKNALFLTFISTVVLSGMLSSAADARAFKRGPQLLTPQVAELVCKDQADKIFEKSADGTPTGKQAFGQQLVDYPTWVQMCVDSKTKPHPQTE